MRTQGETGCAPRPSRWKGPELDALRAAYETAALMVDDLAARFGTSRGNVCRLARRHGWKRRGAERLPPEAHSHWNTYRNIQRWHGRDVALEVVAGIPRATAHSPVAAAPAAGIAPNVPAATPSVCHRTHACDLCGGYAGPQPERASAFPEAT